MGKLAASGESKMGLRGGEREECPDGRSRREHATSEPTRDSAGGQAEDAVDAVSVRARFGVCIIILATLSRAMATRSLSTLPGRAGRGGRGRGPLGLGQGWLCVGSESGRTWNCADGIGREMEVTRALLD